MSRRPKIEIALVERLRACRCHYGHKPGDTWDFDTERGALCPLAAHVAFPFVDILRYGGSVPGNKPGCARFCCPDPDIINVFEARIVPDESNDAGDGSSAAPAADPDVAGDAADAAGGARPAPGAATQPAAPADLKE